METKPRTERRERALLAFALLTLGGWLTATLYADHKRIEAAESEHLASQATVIDENLGRQLVGVDNALKSIRKDMAYLESRTDGIEIVNNRLQSLSDAIPGVRTIQILNKDGAVTASNREKNIGMNFAWRDYFKLARQENNSAILYVSPPFDTVPAGAFAINLTRVLSDAQGQFTGIVSATLDPAYFYTLLNSVTYAPDMWASLTHADGKLFIIVPDQHIPAGADLAKAGSLFARHMESGQTATVLTGKILATGEERMAARRTVRPANLMLDKPLVVAVTRDLGVIFAPWRRDVTLQGGLFGLLVLLTSLGLYIYQDRQRELLFIGAMREKERDRHRTILKMASDGIHIVDRDGLLFEANEAFLRMLGYDDTAIGKLRIPDWDAQDSWEIIKGRLERLTTHRERMVFESRHRRSDGAILEVEISASVIDIDGKSYLCGASRDITERKRAEQQLRDNEYVLSESQRIAHFGSWKYALTGELSWSDETYRIYRLSPDTFSPTVETLMGIIHPNDRQAMQAWMAACLGNEKPGALEFRINTPDGATRILSGCGELRFDVGNRQSYLLGIVHDITESKTLEGELKRSNADLEQFAYVASHDLRSPLRAVISYLSLIKRELAANITPDLEEFIGFAVGGAKRMDALITGLLEYSRTGNKDSKPEAVRLADAISESLMNLVVPIEDASATVTVADGLPTIMGDRMELVRLFQNLIGNALKYRFPDRAPRVTVDWRDGDGEWIIAVRDNGIGIASEDFTRCFGIFQRLVPQNKYEGTGIGLAVCKKIIEHQGGRIWIESEIGVGSTFLIALPA